MFYYSKGFLKQASDRGFVLTTAIDQGPNPKSKIQIKSFTSPVILCVKSVNYNPKENLMLLILNDTESDLEVNLDISKWNLINQDDNKIPSNSKVEKDSVIILSEYTFQDVKLNENEISKDMLTILDFLLIGKEENNKSVNKNLENEAKKSKAFTISQININLNNQNWSLKGKLLKISTVKEFVNKLNGNQGKFRRLQFGDETGIIELVCFNEEVDRVSTLEDQKFYSIINADIKVSKSTCQAWEDTGSNKIELIFTKKSIIEEYEEKNKLFKIFEKPITPVIIVDEKYKHLIPLIDLNSKQDKDVVSVIGVIDQIEDCKVITPKGKDQISLRNFFILDQSKQSFKVAVWGKQAEEFKFEYGNILLITKAKISNFNGITLSIQWETNMVKVEDDWDHISIANSLREWWRGEIKQTDNLSQSLKRKLSLLSN